MVDHSCTEIFLSVSDKFCSLMDVNNSSIVWMLVETI